MDLGHHASRALSVIVLVFGVAATTLAQGRAPVASGGNGLWFDVRDYGAIGDGIADDSAALQSAANAAAAVPRARLLFPPATGYRTTVTVTVPPGVAIDMQAPLVFDGDDRSRALLVGAVDVSSQDLEHVIDVRKRRVSDWTDARSIGVEIHNAFACRITIVQASGFTIGAAFIGSGEGFAGNRVELGQILNNRIGVDLTNFDPGTGIGWCNENVFLNGEFSCWTNTQPRQSRYGVRITSRDNTYPYNNNNLFLKPSFELIAATASPGEALPILLEAGGQNRFASCRDEGNGPVFARVLKESTENEFDIGYGGLVTRIDDQSQHASSSKTVRRSRLRDEPGSAVFLSGSLVDRAVPYDATRSHIAGVHAAQSGSSAVLTAASGIDIQPGHLQVAPNRGVGVFADTSRWKRFVVRRSVVGAQGGRVLVRCHAADGSVLQHNGAPRVSGNVFHAPYWTTAFGGAYSTGSDSDADYYFSVTDDVASIAVLLTGGSAPLKLASFALFSVDGGNVRVWAGYEEGIAGANRALVPPARGVRGRIVYNDNPGPGQDLGWVCVQSEQGATPAVWKSIGTIAQ